MFARLASGASFESAQAELSTVGRLPTPVAPEPGEQIRLRVIPYAKAFTGEVDSWMVGLILFLVTLLLIPPCANIAILVYARTVTRQAEFAARFVLGASRTNIVTQLFVEILVLAVGASVVALFVARLVVWLMLENMRGRGGSVPFWMEFGLSTKTILFVAGLAVLAALIAGAVPALQATGRRMQSGLKSMAGQTRLRLGATWTALVVVQVAFSFALLPTSVEMTWGTLRSAFLGPGFAAGEYLTARLEMNPAGAGGQSDSRAIEARFADRQGELLRHLEAEPGVSGVTASSRVPGEEPWARIELEETHSKESSEPIISVGTGRLSRVNHVDDAFFEVFEIPILTGRGFEPADFQPDPTAVIVNRSFVLDVLGDGNPLGRRIRYRFLSDGASPNASPESWYEIVGVAGDLQVNSSVQTVYHPAPRVREAAVSLALRIRSDPTTAAGRLREVTWAIDPDLRVESIRRLDEIYRQQAVGNYMGASALVAGTVSVLLLSAAGIYALMSFTVNQRRREIGIRSALGAQPRRLLAGIFARALGQVGAGAFGGVLVALLIGHYLPLEEAGGWEVPGVLPAAVALIVTIALLALLGPARRGLRVQPIEELRES